MGLKSGEFIIGKMHVVTLTGEPHIQRMKFGIKHSHLGVSTLRILLLHPRHSTPLYSPRLLPSKHVPTDHVFSQPQHEHQCTGPPPALVTISLLNDRPGMNRQRIASTGSTINPLWYASSPYKPHKSSAHIYYTATCLHQPCDSPCNLSAPSCSKKI